MQIVTSSGSRLDQWMRIATLVLIAGAAMWLVKLFVIVMSDGAESGAGDAAAAVFFLGGYVLLLCGSSAVGLWLTPGRARVVRIVAALLAPVTFFVAVDLLDVVGEAVVGDLGPTYVREEAGILLAALLGLALGVVVARDTQPRRISGKS